MENKVNYSEIGNFDFDNKELLFIVNDSLESERREYYKVFKWNKDEPSDYKIPELAENFIIESIYTAQKKAKDQESFIYTKIIEQTKSAKERHILAIISKLAILGSEVKMLSMSQELDLPEGIFNFDKFKFHYTIGVIDKILKYYNYENPEIFINECYILNNGKKETFYFDPSILKKSKFSWFKSIFSK